MLHFVTSYMKQNKSHKQTLESVQNGLEIIFNIKMVSGASIKFEVDSWLEKSNRLYTTYSYFKESFCNYLNLGGGKQLTSLGAVADAFCRPSVLNESTGFQVELVQSSLFSFSNNHFFPVEPPYLESQWKGKAYYNVVEVRESSYCSSQFKTF